MSVICSANIIVEKIIVYICSFCVANQMCTLSISMKLKPQRVVLCLGIVLQNHKFTNESQPRNNFEMHVLRNCGG